MTSTTRINPDLPLCWEDADTVRIGFERARVRITHPSAATQRLLGALLQGVRTERLSQEAARVGATPAELRELLDALRPILEETEFEPAALRDPATRPLRVLVSDEGRATPGLRETLGATTSCQLDIDPRVEDCELVVHVERYLEPLERAQRWRALGIPHLLIRFTDRAVHVGPVVEADGAPCHSCISLSLVARDPALPVIATQLLGRVPSSEAAATAELAGIYAALLIRRWRSGDQTARRARIVIPVRAALPAGTAREERVPPHPGCACGDPLEAALGSSSAVP